MKVVLFSLFFLLAFPSQSSTLPGSNETYAVLIVGQDVGDYAPEVMDKIAYTFQSNGVKVYKFYFPNSDWNKIKAIADNCSYFVYSGHGCSMCGLDGEFGGLYINDFVMAKDFVEQIHFKRHPLVIIQNSCGAAGSSASDKGDIGFNEAKNRITDTALPYFLSGCGAYFANNWLSGTQEFLQSFLSGKSLKVASDEIFPGFLASPIQRSIANPKELAGKTISVRNEAGDIQIEYDFAYVGDPSFMKQQIKYPVK